MSVLFVGHDSSILRQQSSENRTRPDCLVTLAGARKRARRGPTASKWVAAGFVLVCAVGVIEARQSACGRSYTDEAIAALPEPDPGEWPRDVTFCRPATLSAQGLKFIICCHDSDSKVSLAREWSLSGLISSRVSKREMRWVMWVFTEVADWFDKTRVENEKWIDSELQPWVATTLYDDSPWYRNVGIYAASGTLYALNKFTTTVAAGFVDVLRLGDGVQEGGWGYGKDALRLLMVVGPALRGARWAVSLVAAVDETPLVGNCSWIAATRMARWAGFQPFAALGDVAKAAGLGGIGETGGAFADELLPALKNLGGSAKFVTKELQSVADVAKVVAENPNGATMFSVQWQMAGKNVGHTLYAVRNFLGGMSIIDRSGRAVKSLLELEDLYTGIGSAKVYGTSIVVDSSLIVRSIGTIPTISNIISQAISGHEPEAQSSGSIATPPVASHQPAPASQAAGAGGKAPSGASVIPGKLTVTPQTICMQPNSDMGMVCSTTQTKTYKVGRGEGLMAIAQRVYGDGSKWQLIASANGIKPPKYTIQQGQVLFIP